MSALLAEREITNGLKLIILWGLFIWPVFAGNYNFTILPSGSYFETIILDPSASQVNASLLAYQFKGRMDRKMHTSIENINGILQRTFAIQYFGI